MLRDPRVEKWADVIVRYCLELKAGQWFLIQGNPLAYPLIEALYRKALSVGAKPDLLQRFLTGQVQHRTTQNHRQGHRWGQNHHRVNPAHPRRIVFVVLSKAPVDQGGGEEERSRYGVGQHQGQEKGHRPQGILPGNHPPAQQLAHHQHYHHRGNRHQREQKGLHQVPQEIALENENHDRSTSPVGKTHSTDRMV